MNLIQRTKQHAHTGLLASVMLVYLTFPTWASVANVGLLLMLLFWLCSGQWHAKRQRIAENPGLWFALGLYAWMWIGIAYTDASAGEIGDHLRKYLKLALMAVVVCALSEGIWRRRAWTAYAVAMAFTLLSTYANIWLQLPWSISQNQGWNTDHTVFKDYIAQGILMSMFIAMGLANIVKPSTSKLHKVAWGLVVVLGILSITHLSAGRSAYLAMAAALLGFVFWAAQGLRRWVGLALLVLVLAAIFSTSSVMQSRVAQAINEAQSHSLEDYSSIGQRMYFAKKTSELIREKPLIGWGTGAYHQEFCRVADNAQWCHFGKVHPHNQFLFIWVEHGVVGLALLLGLIFSPMWMTRNAPPHIRGLAAAYTGIFVVISMTHGSLWLSTESHFHTLMGALIFAGYKPSRST
jgi:O-antigen ligase